MTKKSNSNYTPELSLMIKNAVRIADELQYGNNVINKLEAAKDEQEIDRIMRSARIGHIR